MSALAVPEWEDDASGEAPARLRPQVVPGEIPAGVWRGAELGTAMAGSVPSGWDALDAELPGGGWPRHAVTEVLAAQPGILEWRVIGGALRHVSTAEGQIVVVGPPKAPHIAGLTHQGISARHFVWIQAETPAERLWVTEQLIKSGAAGAVVAWLPQARQEQIRRLQICALACEAPVFLFRPAAVRHDSSAAPLRVHASCDLDWQLRLDVFKRRGPAMATPLLLPSIPGGLSSILTPRMLRPSALVRPAEKSGALGSVAPQRPDVRQLAIH